jgi:hypothetical protein
MADPIAWIGIYIRSDSLGLLNAVHNMAPHRFDSRLWDSDQYSLISGTDEEGTPFVSMSLFFLDFTERESFRGALNGINGFMNAALPRSELKMSNCWHHDLLPNGAPAKPDELTYPEIIE